MKRQKFVQRHSKTMNAEIVEIVGILKLKLYHTVNIKMKWRHPKYYKELRKLRNKVDQTISQANSTRGLSGVRSGPGLKLQAAGVKLQAAGVKLSNQPVQASGGKRQAPGSKLQASSHKRQAPIS